MAMMGRPEAWLKASPAAFDDGCASEAPAKSSPAAQILPTTPANTLRFRSSMRGPLELPSGDITARFAEPLRSRLKVRILPSQAAIVASVEGQLQSFMASARTRGSQPPKSGAGQHLQPSLAQLCPPPDASGITFRVLRTVDVNPL